MSAHVVELTTNRRQSEVDQEWERQALLQLRNGDIAPAIAAYAAHDRIAIADDLTTAHEQLIDRWWSVHVSATTAFMAVTRADVAALNEMARQRRREAGELGAEICLASGKEFAVGDRIAFEWRGYPSPSRHRGSPLGCSDQLGSLSPREPRLPLGG